MTADEVRAVVAFETGLSAGDRVEARWTNSFRYYTAAATVVRKNEKSIRVQIDTTSETYARGRTLTIPLLLSPTWSANNRVAPPKETS